MYYLNVHMNGINGRVQTINFFKVAEHTQTSISQTLSIKKGNKSLHEMYLESHPARIAQLVP